MSCKGFGQSLSHNQILMVVAFVSPGRGHGPYPSRGPLPSPGRFGRACGLVSCKTSALCCAGRRQAIFCYTSPPNEQTRVLRSLLVIILVDVYGSVNIDFFLSRERYFKARVTKSYKTWNRLHRVRPSRHSGALNLTRDNVLL